MNSMAVAGIVVCMLSISAAAYSEASLSTNSLLWTEGSELSVLRSFYDDRIILPDLEMITSSEITTEAYTDGEGSAEIGQSAYLMARKQNNGLYALTGTLSSSASGSGVSELASSISMEGSSRILNPWGDINAMSKVEAEMLGLTVASPGTNDYILYTDAQYNIITNTPVLVVPDKWGTLDLKSFKIAFVADPVKFEEPVDEFEQDMVLNFAFNDNELAYAYDFSEDIANDNTAFNSEMQYINSGML